MFQSEFHVAELASRLQNVFFRRIDSGLLLRSQDRRPRRASTSALPELRELLLDLFKMRLQSLFSLTKPQLGLALHLVDQCKGMRGHAPSAQPQEEVSSGKRTNEVCHECAVSAE